MAGTVTFTVVGRHMVGNRRLHQVDANITNYVTGGVTVTPNNCGLRVIDVLEANKVVTDASAAVTGFKYGYDKDATSVTPQLLSAFNAAGTQVTNNSNHGVVRLIAIGQ